MLQFSAAAYPTFEDAGTVTVTVSRVGGSNGAVSVNYATQDGTALAGTDYTAASGTLSWASGDATDKIFTVPLIDRKITNGSMVSFGVNLSQPMGAALGSPAAATVTITDNDMAQGGHIQFSAAAYSTSENAGSVTLTATRVGGASGATSVTYATGDGSAIAGHGLQRGERQPLPGRVAMPPPRPSLSPSSIAGSRADRSTSKCRLLLSAAPPRSALPTTATVTINDNDAAPAGVLQFSAPNFATSEAAGNATLTVSRVGGSSGAVSVNYGTMDVNAQAGIDYTAASGTLSWADGDATSKVISVPIIDRKINGATPLTFSVSLSAPTGGAAIGTPNPATVSISENDVLIQPSIQLSYKGSTTFAAGTVITILATVADPSNLLSQVQFFLDGTAVATLPATASGNANGYSHNFAFADRGTHTVTAAATSRLGGRSTSNVLTFTVYAEPTINYSTLPSAITFGQTTPFQFEVSVSDPDNQVRSVTVTVTDQSDNPITDEVLGMGADGNYVFNSTFPGRSSVQDEVGTGSFKFVPSLVALDGYGVRGTTSTVTIAPASPTSLVGGATATFLAGLDHVKVPADGSLSVAVMTTFAVDSTGASVPAVTRVDFYADGVLFASKDGNGKTIPLPSRTPGHGPIASDFPVTLGTHLFEAVYKVLSDLQPVTLTAVATTSDGLSQLTAPLHLTPVAETGTPPVVTLGPLTGGQPLPAGASLMVPVTVSAPSIPVAMVQYYLNGALLSAATAPPYDVTVTPPTAGPYGLTAVVTDTNGVATFAEPLAFTAVPTVSVTVKGDGKAVVGGEKGKVIFTRTGDDLSAPLTVYFKPTGAAKAGVNFRDFGRQLVIPAGAASATTKIKPLDTGTGPLALALNLKLLPAPDGSYATVGKVKAKLMVVQTQ